MTNLTDRMRTCTAHVRSILENTDDDLPPIDRAVTQDAVSLLIEAVDALEKFVVEPAQKALEAQQQFGEPMQIPGPDSGKLTYTGPPLTFTDPGVSAEIPTRSSRSCPKCGSRANKKVHVKANRLECPACEYQWPFVMEGKWV